MAWYYFGNKPARRELLDELLSPPPRVVSIDVETPSLKDTIPIGMSVATSPDDAFYFPMLPSIPPEFPWHILKDKSIKKVYHNAPFDLGCFAAMKYEVDTENIADTAVLAHLLGYDAKLVHFSPYVNMETQSAGDLMAEQGAKTMLDLPEEMVARKCCEDSSATIALYNKFYPQVDSDYYDVEMAVIPILMEMSRKGLLIDHEVRDRLERKYAANVEYYRQIAEGQGFNIASPYQVGFILAKRGNFLPFTRSKKQLATDDAILKKCSDPIASLTLLFRKENYLLTHYLVPWAGAERAYTRFHLDAITGRVSSTKRNMQNIPKGECRNMFLPDSGIFTDWDWSQLQLRILAYLSQDKRMLYVFETGGSIHEDAAKEMDVYYDFAKSTNFAMIFGATDETLAETAGVPVDRAKVFRSKWFSVYKEAADWIISQQESALRAGKITTMYGRVIRLPVEERPSELRRKAVNYPIQGGEAEIIKRSLPLCKQFDLRLLVHDEYLIDGRAELPEELEHLAPFHTPISIKYLERWE